MHIGLVRGLIGYRVLRVTYRKPDVIKVTVSLVFHEC